MPKSKKNKRRRLKAHRKNKRPREVDDPTRSRSEQMHYLREKGWSYESIAERYQLTRQRVWQIINNEDEGKGGSDTKRPRPVLHARSADRKLRQAENPQTIGDRIVKRRLKMQLSLKDLAERSGIPYGVLSAYENNTRQPNIESLQKLTLMFGISAHWLVFGVRFKKSSV
jgi:transcriptional regulator with XRE-family HTH domain